MRVAWRTVLSLSIVLGAVCLAAADEIHLKDGTSVQGAVVGGSDELVVLKGADGKLKTYRKADIVEVAKSKSPTANISEANIQAGVSNAASDTALNDPAKIQLLDEYRRRKKEIKPGEFDKNLELAGWCLENSLADEAKAEVGYVLKTDDLDQFKKAFVFCARSKAERILAETPTATMSAAFASLREKQDPLLSVCKEFLLSAKEVRGAESRIWECEASIARADREQQALEDHDSGFNGGLGALITSAVHGADRSPCPECAGEGHIQKSTGEVVPGMWEVQVPLTDAWRYQVPLAAAADPRRYRPPYNPTRLLQAYPHKWVPAHVGYTNEVCPTCHGTGDVSSGLQEQIDEQIGKADAAGLDMTRRRAAFADYSSKLAGNLSVAQDSLQLAKERLEKSRDSLLALVGGKASVREVMPRPRR